MPYNVFDIEPNIPVEEEAEWNVVKTGLESWKEVRRLKSSRPRHFYTLNFRGRTQAVSQELFGFYNQQSGDLLPFYWENPMENPIAGEVLGSGDGNSSVYYSDNYPVASGSYVVRVNGTVKTEVTHYTLSGGTGAVTFKAGSIPAVSQEVQMDYRFYRVVRFNEKPLRRLTGYQLADLECRFQEVL